MINLQGDFIRMKGWMIFTMLQMKYIKEGGALWQADL